MGSFHFFFQAEDGIRDTEVTGVQTCALPISQIKFRVTEEERALIEEKMKKVPTRNMEAYLRKMAIDGYIIQIDHSDIE